MKTEPTLMRLMMNGLQRDPNDTAGYMECKECNAIYRRPDKVHWR